MFVRAALVALSLLATSCVVTLETEARDAFSETFACPARAVTVTPTAQPAHEVVRVRASQPGQPPQVADVDAWYSVLRAQGCGQRRTYVCGKNWSLGCLRPGDVVPDTLREMGPAEPDEAPGSSFPPTLVDQAPPPPQPVPDTQN